MPILAFHNNSFGFLAGLNNYAPSRFKKLLQFLIDSEYQIASLKDYIETSDKKNLVVLTFDDGYESFYQNVFPILNEMKIPATIFIPSHFIGKINSWDYTGNLLPAKHLSKTQIEELSRNQITIGSHGLSHRCLTNLTDRLLTIELTKSKEIIENIIGKKISFISYPFGRFDSHVESIAFKAGYRQGLSLSHLAQKRSNFTLARYAIYAFDTFYSISKKLKSGPLNGLEKIKGAIMNSYAAGTIALNRLRRK